MCMQCPIQRDQTVLSKVDHKSHWRNDGTCSYCGSISPRQFFKAINEGRQIVPTDKNYKAYIDGRKFYFQHLSPKDRQKFIKLYNKGKMNLAYPGYFYTQPYFCTEAAG